MMTLTHLGPGRHVSALPEQVPDDFHMVVDDGVVEGCQPGLPSVGLVRWVDRARVWRERSSGTYVGASKDCFPFAVYFVNMS